MRSFLFLFFLLHFLFSSAQNPDIQIGSSKIDTSALEPIKIGEKVPDIFFNHMANYKKASAYLSDFKGKLVVLDFWSTSCVVCIAQFPKLTKLQEQFASQLQILSVGFDGHKKGSIKDFLEKNKGKKYEMPLATSIQSFEEDKLLLTLFPSIGFPHLVWINKDGVLSGLTDHLALTNDNIVKVVNGGNLADISKGNRVNITKEPFLILPDTKTGIYTTFGSVFTGYKKDYTAGFNFGYQYDSSIIRIFDVNNTVFSYYLNTYKSEYPWLNSKRILVETTRSDFYKDWFDYSNSKIRDDVAFREFAKNNLVCYELILPKTKSNSENVYRYIIQDLDMYFGIQSRIEKRKVKYLALIRSSKAEKFKSTGNGNSPYVLRSKSKSFDSPDTLQIFNTKVSEIVRFLNSQIRFSSNLSIIDETAYNNPIDINVTVYNGESSVSQIRAYLSKYDLDLIEKEMEMEMLVLYDKR